MPASLVNVTLNMHYKNDKKYQIRHHQICFFQAQNTPKYVFTPDPLGELMMLPRIPSRLGRGYSQTPNSATMVPQFSDPHNTNSWLTVVFRPANWKCITGWKIGEKLEKEWSDFDPQRKCCYFWGSGLWCKVSSKLSEICDRRRGDRQKDTQTRVIL